MSVLSIYAQARKQGTETKGGDMRKLLVVLSAVLLVALHLNVAAAQDNSGPSSATATVPMTIDCARFDDFTAEGQQWATSHGYCSGGKVAGPHPDNTVFGDCGEATFTLENEFDSGVVAVHMDLDSYLIGSSMILVSWQYGLTYGPGFEQGFYYDGIAYPDSEFWSRSSMVEVTSGDVSGYMTGWVQLSIGLDCDILYPNDEIYVP